MADTFFDDGATQETPQEPSKVKVGEREYTQEELSALVGLGETAREIELKQNTKLDRVFPEFTKSRQELKDLKGELEELRSTQERFKQAITGENEAPDPEALKAQAIEQARSLGLVTKEDAMQAAFEAVRAKETLDEIKAINKDAESNGKPRVDPKELLDWMGQNGLENASVTVGYKLKYENELDAWKQNKLEGIKQPGFETQSSSTAGSKEPPTDRDRLTKSNFSDRLRAFVESAEGKGNQ